MVNLGVVQFVRNRGPDEFWRKRKVFKLTAHYFGRRRNCYSIAIRNLHRALVYATKGRHQKKLDRKELWVTRIEAACEELGISYKTLMENLARSQVAINHKTLMDLAIWEPRTFKCLTRLAQCKDFQENPRGLNSLEKLPEGVITRGML